MLGTGNGLSYIIYTFAESFQLKISVLYWSLCLKAGLSSLSDGCAKYIEKEPDVSDSNQNVEIKCSSKQVYST